MIEMERCERQQWDCDRDCGPIQRPQNLEAVGAPRRAWVVRWLQFNAVGAIGVVVQLSALTLLVRVLRLPIAVATGLAVETAIIHNFLWHRDWTWADRKSRGESASFIEAVRCLFRFNSTTGFVSLAGNMILMPLLVALGIGLLKSNLVAIATCSLVNFVLSDRFVFMRRQ